MRGAGTDANVWLELVGTGAVSSGRLWLHSNPESFDAGRIDTFRVTSAKPLGDLEEVVIGHDGKGASPAWHLELVVVTEVASGRRWWCECGQWLDAGPGQEVSKRLRASATDPAAKAVQYEVRGEGGDGSCIQSRGLRRLLHAGSGLVLEGGIGINHSGALDAQWFGSHCCCFIQIAG
jgi:hypothetical protein